MRVVCAWCQREGRSGFIRVEPPLDDQSETHGICARHQQSVLAQLPSRSFPSTEYLFIVSAADPALYDLMRRRVGRLPGVTVIVDRRARQRRSAEATVPVERRQGDRRMRRLEPTPFGYTLVRFPRSAAGETSPGVAGGAGVAARPKAG